MKKLIILTVFMIPFLTSCVEDGCKRSTQVFKYEGVYMAESDYRIQPEMQPSRDFENVKKIVRWGSYILLNEERQGVHFINNADPSNPINEGFLEIPGNLDFIVLGNMLYADNFTDLVVIDINDPTRPKLNCRAEDVFQSFGTNEDNEILVYYKESLVEEDIPCEETLPRFTWGQPVFFAEADDRATLSEAMISSDSRASSPNSVNGSTSRFTAGSGFLYTVNETTLTSFDISNGCPELMESSSIFGNSVLETLFTDGRYLFIGANNGMHILTLEPTPQYLSMYSHQVACDPVIVDGDYAYVTLRNGVETRCGGWTNQLDQVDISNIQNPRRVRTVPMDNPHGLAITNDKLVVCEGGFGIRMYDVSDPETFNQKLLHYERTLSAFDVIPGRSSDQLLVIGENGLLQYRYNEDYTFELLSTIQTR
jgi:hypothetical protein